MNTKHKYVAWTVIFVTAIVAATLIALFGTPEAQGWITSSILPFLAGMLWPGSPLGALFKSAPAVTGVPQ